MYLHYGVPKINSLTALSKVQIFPNAHYDLFTFRGLVAYDANNRSDIINLGTLEEGLVEYYFHREIGRVSPLGYLYFIMQLYLPPQTFLQQKVLIRVGGWIKMHCEI